MFAPDKSHPGYSETMEALCLLSKTPMPMSQVVEELGLRDQDCLIDTLAKLQRVGVNTKVQNIRGDGRCVAITEVSWPKARKLGIEYLKAVDPDLATA